MPIEADGVVWGALLSACWFWTKMELIGRVAEKIFNLDPKAVSAHVILSNMHSILGKWGEKMNHYLHNPVLENYRGYCSQIEKNYAIKREGKDFVLAEI
nr:pentatricopeptide repeat-containing protein [Quercus suber]